MEGLASPSLPHALEIIPHSSKGREPTLSVTLPYADRYRRRMKMVTDDGMEFMLNLSEPTELKDGDGLKLEDGSIIVVKAADEPVADIVCDNQHHLVRVAWHLGNRHLPTQIMGDQLRILQDHVIEDMARGLGATVERKEAPFNPEGGAYGHGRTHGHAHGHSHGHDHQAHGHSHAE